MLLNEQDEDEGIAVSSRLLGLVLLGITLVFVGIAVIIVATIVLGGSGSVGGIIFIGPIPIVFGAGPEARYWLIAISVILSVISIVLFMIMNRRVRKIKINCLIPE